MSGNLVDRKRKGFIGQPALVEKDVLVSALRQLTRSFTHMVEDGKNSFERLAMDQFMSSDCEDGILAVYPVYLYAECMEAVGVQSREGLEKLWGRYYTEEAVRDCVEELLSVEEAYERFMADSDKALQRYEDEIAVSKASTVGDHLPSDLSLLDARSGETVSFESIWKRSPFTVFILIRHYV